MTAQTKNVLKTYFEAGDKPTAAQFVDLIDSIPGETGALADADIPSTIARDTEVTSAIGAHAIATDPHGDRAYAAGLGANYDAAGAATSAVSAHNSLATAHGLTANISAALAAAASPGAGNAFITRYNMPPFGFRNRIVCIGDSITYGNSGQMTEYPRWLAYLTGGYVKNSGVSGNTLAQVLARLSADVFAYSPGICVIMCGTNDIGGTDAAMIATIKQITQAILQANILPVWCTITTRSDFPTRVPQIRRINMWLAAYVQDFGLPLADLFTTTAQSDGTPIAGYLTDGLHPSTSMAIACAATVYAALPDTARRAVPWRFAGDAETLATNGNFALDSNSDGVPDSWNASGNDPANTVWSRTAHPTDGQWWSIAKVATGLSKTAGGYRAFTLTAGATYRLLFDLDISITGSVAVVAYISHTGSAQVDFIVNNPQITALTGTRFWLDFVVPAGATGTTFTFYAQGTGAFTIKMGRVMLFELVVAL